MALAVTLRWMSGRACWGPEQSYGNIVCGIKSSSTMWTGAVIFLLVVLAWLCQAAQALSMTLSGSSDLHLLLCGIWGHSCSLTGLPQAGGPDVPDQVGATT